jgi:cold shock CspA family protein
MLNWDMIIGEFLMPKGTVEWFDKERGVGSINQESGDDVFVDISQVCSGPLTKGDIVEFEYGENKKGLYAKNVTKPFSQGYLIQCQCCSQEFSNRANQCPRCGDPNLEYKNYLAQKRSEIERERREEICKLAKDTAKRALDNGHPENEQDKTCSGVNKCPFCRNFYFFPLEHLLQQHLKDGGVFTCNRCFGSGYVMSIVLESPGGEGWYGHIALFRKKICDFCGGKGDVKVWKLFPEETRTDGIRFRQKHFEDWKSFISAHKSSRFTGSIINYNEAVIPIRLCEVLGIQEPKQYLRNESQIPESITKEHIENIKFLEDLNVTVEPDSIGPYYLDDKHEVHGIYRVSYYRTPTGGTFFLMFKNRIGNTIHPVTTNLVAETLKKELRGWHDNETKDNMTKESSSSGLFGLFQRFVDKL